MRKAWPGKPPSVTCPNKGSPRGYTQSKKEWEFFQNANRSRCGITLQAERKTPRSVNLQAVFPIKEVELVLSVRLLSSGSFLSGCSSTPQGAWDLNHAYRSARGIHDLDVLFGLDIPDADGLAQLKVRHIHLDFVDEVFGSGFYQYPADHLLKFSACFYTGSRTLEPDRNIHLYGTAVLQAKKIDVHHLIGDRVFLVILQDTFKGVPGNRNFCKLEIRGKDQRANCIGGNRKVDHFLSTVEHAGNTTLRTIILSAFFAEFGTLFSLKRYDFHTSSIEGQRGQKIPPVARWSGFCVKWLAKV